MRRSSGRRSGRRSAIGVTAGPRAQPKPAFADWHLQKPVPWRETDLNEDVLVQWLRLMLLGRQIEARGQALFKQGRARFVVTWSGHEAAQVGVGWPLRPNHDWLAPYYRDAVLCFRMGLSPLDHMLSVLAKSTDPASGGKQTPGHYSDSRLKIISGGSPVATQLVHATGVGYALRADSSGAIVMASYGEGAGSQGDAHEAFNFAAIHKLPVVFVCQNNGIAISVPVLKQYGVRHVAQRAAGYGFPGVTVDGRDPVTCYHVAKQAVARARAGQGPTLIECLVDRLSGHTSEDDQRRYRSEDELKQLAANDCLDRFRQQLLAEGVITAAKLSDLDEEVGKEVELATREALAAPEPTAEDALTNVYAAAAAHEPRVDAGSPSESMNMVQAIRSALADEMERDERVMVLGEDVGAKGGVFLATEGLCAHFGEGRVLDTPLAESSIAGVALGLALAGKRPVAEIQFADFVYPAFNQIINEIAKMRYRTNGDWSVPIVIRAPMGGHVHGALYHSQSVEARLATPGLKIVIPSSPSEAKGLLLAAIRDPDPVIFLEHKRLYRMFKEDVPRGQYLIPLQQARVVRKGDSVSVFCYGLMVHYAAEAAQRLEAEGIGVEIVDLRTVYPLDQETIVESVKKTGKALILYEDNYSVSVGSEVAALIADDAWQWLDGPVKRLGGLDVPAMPFADVMEDHFMPSPDKIYRALHELADY
jgi:2-oxoisovalerate dehydrogenase E1 component